MHVGLFIDTYYPVIDGVIKVVEAYATRLVKKCDVTIFTADGKDLAPSYDDQFPYKVERCFALTGGTKDAYSRGLPMIDFKFKAALNKANLDIIHIHSAYTVGLVAKGLSRRKNIPMVGTLHSHFRPDVEEYVGKFIGKAAVKLMMSAYNACDECWAVNESVGLLFQKEYGLKSPIRVMPYSTEHYPLKDKNAARHEVNAMFGLEEGDFVMMSVGRIDLQKNEEFTIRSLMYLKERIPHFKMLFVGGGGKKKVLEEMVDQLGLRPYVIFCGEISDMATMMKMYARTDLLLFPSIADTYGLVKVEAACQQTPTLFIKDTMVASGVRDKYNGFIADNNEENYACRIEDIYHNRNLIEQAGMGAYKDIYTTWDDLVDNVYENYQEIIEKHR